MEALASYARQAGDETMHDNAKRIQIRAMERAGEFIKEIKPAKNQLEAISSMRQSCFGGGSRAP
jgi:hypothetical protein